MYFDHGTAFILVYMLHDRIYLGPGYISFEAELRGTEALVQGLLYLLSPSLSLSLPLSPSPPLSLSPPHPSHRHFIESAWALYNAEVQTCSVMFIVSSEERNRNIKRLLKSLWVLIAEYRIYQPHLFMKINMKSTPVTQQS